MMSISVEVVLWLSHVETPWSKVVVTLGRSSVSLNLDTAYMSRLMIGRGSWVPVSRSVRHGVGVGIWHGQSGCQA